MNWHQSRETSIDLKAALRAIGDLMFELTADGRFVSFWGPENQLYASPATFRGRKVSEILPAPQARRILAAITMAQRTESVQVVHYDLSVNGSDRHYEARIAPTDSGHFIALVRDVHEQKVLENRARANQERLRESEERFRLMADSAPVLLWMSGRDSECNFFNRTWLEFSGRTLEQELGVGWAEGVHHEDFQRCMDTYLSSFVARRPFRMEYRLRRHDGNYRWLLDSGVPRFSPGQLFEGYIGSCVDITDINEAKELMAVSQRALVDKTAALERSNAELEQFAYVASHDLQEPLRMVDCYVQLLARDYHGKLDETADEFISYATDGARRMRRLIDDLLAYSRIEMDGDPFEWVPLSDVVAETLKSLSVALKESGIVVGIGNDLPTVWADRSQIEHLVQNLIANAIKFRRANAPQIGITSIGHEACWEIVVEDNGIGFEQKFSERIFQMFHRLHDRKSFEGSGIGLSLAKRIVERHSGTIWVTSDVGVGSKFHFTLPRHPIRRQTATQSNLEMRHGPQAEE